MTETPESETPEYETLLFDVREQVATITLNRPDVRNAFGAGMGPELDDAFQRCDEDDDIRAVVAHRHAAGVLFRGRPGAWRRDVRQGRHDDVQRRRAALPAVGRPQAGDRRDQRARHRRRA